MGPGAIEVGEIALVSPTSGRGPAGTLAGAVEGADLEADDARGLAEIDLPW
jgi:hypothetical protein